MEDSVVTPIEMAIDKATGYAGICPVCAKHGCDCQDRDAFGREIKRFALLCRGTEDVRRAIRYLKSKGVLR